MELRPGSHQELPGIQRRAGLLVLGLCVGLAGLLLRAWHLEVLRGSYYRALSEDNRVRLVRLHPLRGLIYDRHGTPIVTNTPTFGLYLIPEYLRNPNNVVERLSRLVSIEPAETMRRLATTQSGGLPQPVKVREGLGFAEVAVIEAARETLPGVEIVLEARRDYPYGALAAHLLGYTGEASPEWLSRDRDLVAGDLVGRAGAERAFDAQVRGVPGQKGIEVDALGHERDLLRVEDSREGDHLYLTLDLALQRAAEDALGADAGAVVAMDPRTGAVLAMASHPAFDPNWVSRGLSAADWARLQEDPGRPLLNRAMQGLYPPGSVFKLVVATAALEKAATAEEAAARRVFCRGLYPFGPRVFRDWKKGGHGSMNLYRALVESCDVYFYDQGNHLGIDAIAESARQYGLDRATGIELPGEKVGLIPSADWKQRALGEVWYPGETLSAAIGQGYITTTPLQLAVFISTIATGGWRPHPHVLKGVRRREVGLFEAWPHPSSTRVAIRDETLAFLKAALRDVVADPRGTGHAAQSALVSVAGKTGTAQVVALRPGVPRHAEAPALKDHAWFAAYAPAEAPRLAVVVLVEHAGAGGGKTAAPRARRIIEEFFRHERALADAAL